MSNIPSHWGLERPATDSDNIARAASWVGGVALVVYGVHGRWGVHAAAAVFGVLLLWAARSRS